MNDKAIQAYQTMLLNIAKTYGIQSAEKMYSVQPTHEQELLDKIVESDAFLGQINMIYVDQMKGEKVFGSANVVKGKRTDTDTTDRMPSNIVQLANKAYELFPTEFDFALKYSMIDAWAKFPDFQSRYSEWIRKAVALSRIRTGWYGTEAAATTDSGSRDMGEDTNKGWFQLLRDYNSGSQYLTDTAIKIGAETDNTYPNIDSAVHDLYQLIAPEHRTPGMRVYVGNDLVADEKARLYAAHGGTPTEKEREKIEASITTFAGLPRDVTPSYFPTRGLLITDPMNLSIYIQSGSVRRQQVDNPKRSQVEDYNSANEGYIVENEEAAAAIDFNAVQLHDGNAWA